MLMVQAPKADENMLDLWSISRLWVFGRVVFYTVGLSSALLGVGYLLDQWLGTWPAFFVAAVIIALPLVQFLLYKRLRRYASDEISKLND